MRNGRVRDGWVALGSNLGRRDLMLAEAERRISMLEGVEIVQTSPIYETEPVGPVQQDRFLNKVLRVFFNCEPEIFLCECLAIETSLGRDRAIRWGPRVIDIDLLAVDDVSFCSDRLVLPHPEAHHRAFVLLPWADIAPDFILAGRRIRDWLNDCDQAGCRRL